MVGSPGCHTAGGGALEAARHPCELERAGASPQTPWPYLADDIGSECLI